MNRIDSKLPSFRRCAVAALCAAVALLAAPALALPGPTGVSFAKGAKFTVAGYTNANGTARSELSGFPVLVQISEDSPSGFSYADLASSKGDDLCFIAMDGTGIPFEIDEWHSDGTSFIWVRLPTMTNGTEFVMCWGGGTSGKNVCNDNPWSDYVGVWHMSQANGTVEDSSVNDLDAIPGGTPANSIAVDGKIGKARQNAVSGSAGNLTVPNYSSVYDGTAFTASGWFYMADYNSNDSRLFSRKSNYTVSGGWETFAKYDKNLKVGGKFGMRGKTNSKTWQSDANIDLKSMGWTFLTFAYNGTTVKMYTNGVAVAATGSIDGSTESTNPLGIGNYNGGTGNASFFGYIDECRLLKSTASDDWVVAEYASVADVSFLSAGTAQAYGGDIPPSVSVAVTDRQYTNASFMVSVGSLGTDAAQADVSAKFAATDDFASPLWTTNYTVLGLDAQTVSLAGLATGTTYYMQAQIVNDQNVTNTSPVVTLATLAPGAPAGTATFDERGFSTLAATGTTTAFGTGGESAAMRLEASTDGFETVAAFSPEVVAALGESAPLTISGLSPTTAYALRLRITNNWGVAATVALPDVATRDVPFSTTGLGWTFSPDGSTVDVTFGVSGIYDGATGSATLFYGTSPNPSGSQGEKSFSGPATLEWRGLPVSANPMYAKIVLTARIAGQDYSQTYAAMIAKGSRAVSISSLADHASVPTAVRLRVGDVASLPEIGGAQSYLVPNTRFLSLEGTTATALEPGVGAVQLREGDSVVTTMCVLILPDAIPGGSVYIAKYDTGSNTWIDANWNDPAKWEKVGSETNDSWPQRAGDIAFIPLHGNGSAKVTLASEITLGALYVGSSGDMAMTLDLKYAGDGDVRLAFDRRDGKPAVFQINANTTTDNGNKFRMLTTVTKIRFAWLVDSFLDLGWDGQGEGRNRARLERNETYNKRLFGFEIPEGVTLTFRNVDTKGPETYASGRLQPGPFVGGGTFWNRSQSTVIWNDGEDLAGFTGLLRDSGGYGSLSTDRCGASFPRGPSTTNVTAETVGWAAVNSGAPTGDWNRGVGEFEFGVNHGSGASAIHPGTNWFPRAFTFHGGMTRVNCEQRAWRLETEPEVEDRKRTGALTIACGLNTFWGTGRDPAKANGCTPINVFEADALVHQNKATLVIKDDSLKSNPETVTNEMTILHGWREFAVGDTSVDPRQSAAHAVVPWILCPLDWNWGNQLVLAAFDSQDRLVRPVVTTITSTADGASAIGQSVILYDRQITFLSDGSYLALYLHNTNKEKKLGEGKTLTITSGGLTMNGAGTAIGTEDGGTANGSLFLGDADHPAYVWAKSNDPAKPNEIWAPATAPGGFVAAYFGHLLLGGNQTNILEEIVVNGGSLQLGTTNSPCRLAKNLPIRIYANATLKLPNADSTGGKLLYFDGAAGWFGKVEIADGVEAECKKAFWRDYPESPEWTTLPRGYYSGDEATANSVDKCVWDPVHFSGSGVMRIVQDECIDATIMILR